MGPATTADWITAAATAVAATAAIVALYGAWTTIRDNRLTACRRLTYEYVERLEDLELVKQQAMTASFVRGGIRPPKISRLRWATMDSAARRDTAGPYWRALMASSSLKDRWTVFQLLAYPNTLEGLASMYNGGLLDRAIVKTQVEVDAKSFWNKAEWWVYQLRSEMGKGTFRDIEVMIEDLAKQKAPEWYS
jgi:hypothetical protein